jgi:uncharacterized MAPEG superfamily protein
VKGSNLSDNLYTGYYDNLNPRDQLDKAPASAVVGLTMRPSLSQMSLLKWSSAFISLQTKMAKRATAAHQNSWEAFAYFTASCLTAHICQVSHCSLAPHIW